MAKSKSKAKAKAASKSKPSTKAKPKAKVKAKAKAKAKPKVKVKAKAKAKAKAKPVAKAKPKAKPAKAKQVATPAPQAPAASLIDQAMAAAEDGNLEQAATLMLDAAAADPNDWRLPNEAGIFYYRLERYDDSLRCYDMALALVPDNVPLRMNRALVFILTDHDDQARAALQEVLQLDALHAPAYFELGKLEQKAGRAQDAIDYFNTALAHETMGTLVAFAGAPPRNERLIALAMLNKARCYFELGSEDEGVDQAQTLWQRSQDEQSILRLAQELAERGRAAAANRVRALVS